jgi:hypothetical protein
MEKQKPGIFQTDLRKNNEGKIRLSSFKTFHIATAIKTM